MTVHRISDRPGRDIERSGGGGYDGGMEARIAKLESDVEFLKRDVSEIKGDIKELRGEIMGVRTTDFRITFAAIIGVALGLAGLMAKGFGWLS